MGEGIRTGSAPQQFSSDRLALAPNASSLFREHLFVSVGTDLCLHYNVLGVVLLGRPSSARRVPGPEFLGNVDLYVLPGSTGLRDLDGLQIRPRHCQALPCECHLPHVLLVPADFVDLRVYDGWDPHTGQSAATHSMAYRTRL